ncbi:MAG TPA: hypothetical protein VF699_08485 [Caulobacteraceae bacterium]
MPRLIRFEAVGMIKSYPLFVNPLHVRAVQPVSDEVTRLSWADPGQMPVDVRGGVQEIVALIDGAMK